MISFYAFDEQALEAINCYNVDSFAKEAMKSKICCLPMQGSSLEDRIKSMSVSEAHLPGKRFTKAELKEIQRALSGRPTEDILVSPSS